MCNTYMATFLVKQRAFPYKSFFFSYPCAFFNSAPCHEGVLGEWKHSSSHSLTSALDGGEWSASRPGRFTPRERAPGTHWIRGWVGPELF
jgi:hypothetical protein